MPAPPTFCHFPAWPVPLELPLHTLEENPCSYLPGELSRIRAFICHEMHGELYEELLVQGFRRSGTLFYQPLCRACRQCIPIRVPTAGFYPRKSQRRVLRRNEDLRLDIVQPEPTDENFALYQRFMQGRHGHSRQGSDRETFERFLYNSPVSTLEMRYYAPGDRLVGIGICDATPYTLSSVYFYFDPAESRRSLGTYSQLQEIRLAQAYGLTHVYLGYWVPNSATMHYKADFRPHELLGPDGEWRLVSDPPE